MDGREETSIWKKETTFRRKPKTNDEPAAPPVAPPVDPRPPVSQQFPLPPVTPPPMPETAPPAAGWTVPPITSDSSLVPTSHEAAPVVEPISDQPVRPALMRRLRGFHRSRPRRSRRPRARPPRSRNRS